MEEAREQKQPDEETPEEAGILMKRAAEEWLKTMKKRWKPTTSGMYQSIIGHYIIPILGNYMVTEIEKEILEEFVETIERYSKKEVCLAAIKDISALSSVRFWIMPSVRTSWIEKDCPCRSSGLGKKSRSFHRNRILKH